MIEAILSVMVVFALFILLCCIYFISLENIRRSNCKKGRHAYTHKGVCKTCGNDSNI